MKGSGREGGRRRTGFKSKLKGTVFSNHRKEIKQIMSCPPLRLTADRDSQARTRKSRHHLLPAHPFLDLFLLWSSCGKNQGFLSFE